MQFRILGPLEVEDAGRALPLGGAKQRALLAYLLLSSNQVVSSNRLADALWGESLPTATANALQYHVSQLRKVLGDNVIATRGSGYLLRVEADELDLLRFERLVDTSLDAEPEQAARLLAEALELYRGEPLADLAEEPFAQLEIRRLEELRLSVLERRAEADLALGRHARLVSELEALVRANPLRERLTAALMRALYGTDRQADALEVYRRTRQMFVGELGIEPSPALRELERAILRQDPTLDLQPPNDAEASSRSILVVAAGTEFDDLLAVAEPLATRPRRELILARLLTDDSDLGAATAALAARREGLMKRSVACRVAAFTASKPGGEAAFLAAEQQVDLVLAAMPDGMLELDTRLADLLESAPCDVAVLTGSVLDRDGPVVTPFGGADHDWSAIELAASLASSTGTTLRLLGTAADTTSGRRDASRLLARASLLVQQVVGIVTEPVLIPPGDRGVVEAAAGARMLVIGLSDRWRTEGIGAVRSLIAATAGAPVLFVRRGERPGGLAPPGTLTRFTWTVGGAAAEDD